MRKKLQNIVRHPLFGFTASYLLIVVLLLGICALSLSLVFRAHEKSSLAANEALLQQSAEAVESSLDSTQLFTEAMMSNATLRRLMSRQAEVYELRTAQQNLSFFNDANGLVVDYFLYMARSDTILNPQRGSVKIHQYIDYFFPGSGLDTEQWRKDILMCGEAHRLFSIGQARINGALRPALLEAISFIDLQSSARLGTAVYTLDETRLRQLLLPGAFNDQSLCFVLDGEGAALVLSQPAAEAEVRRLSGIAGNSVRALNGSRYQIVTYVSARYGLTFGVAKPYSLLWASTLESLRSVILVIGLIFLFATIVVIWAYFSNHRPLKSIVNHLAPAAAAGQGQAANGLWQINGSIETLSSANEQLRLSLTEQQTQLRNLLFSRLMRGEAAQEGFIEELLAQIQMPLTGSLYRGVYVYLPESGADARKNALAEAHMINELHRQPYLHFLSMDSESRFACLFATSPERSCEEILSSLHKSLAGRLGLECLLAAGRPVSQLRDLHHSFADALQLLEERNLGQFLFIRDEKPASSAQYAYSAAEEQAFRRYVNANAMEDINVLLEQIYQRNFFQLSLDSLQRTRLYCRMLDTLYSANSEAAISDQLYFHINELKPQEFFAELRRQYAQLCSATASSKLREQNELSQQILHYIQAHMDSPDMGLPLVAERFKMNEKYLSLFIREHAGITFSAYLENVRMGAAQRLLTETGLSVNDIAVQTGYLNASTFRRAFNRVAGMSPSQYRELEARRQK